MTDKYDARSKADEARTCAARGAYLEFSHDLIDEVSRFARSVRVRHANGIAKQSNDVGAVRGGDAVQWHVVLLWKGEGFLRHLHGRVDFIHGQETGNVRANVAQLRVPTIEVFVRDLACGIEDLRAAKAAGSCRCSRK